MAFDQQKLLEMLAAMRGQVEGERAPAAQAPMPPVQETMNEMAPPQPEYKPQSMPYSMNPYTNLPTDKEGMDQGLREQYLSGQQNLLKDLLKQRAMIGAMQARPIQADSTPTIAGWFKLGSNPESSLNKQILDSARPESYEDNQKRLQEALKTSMAGQNTMTDNDLQMLKMKLEDEKSKRDSGKEARFQQAMDYKAQEALRKDLGDLDKGFRKSRANFNKIKDLLKPDEKGTVSIGNIRTILNSFSRAVGDEKGNMAEGDVRRSLLDNIELKLAEIGTQFSSDPDSSRVPVKSISTMYAGIKAAEAALKDFNKGRLTEIDAVYGEPDSLYANMYYTRGGKKQVEAMKKEYGLDQKDSGETKEAFIARRLEEKRKARNSGGKKE